MGSRRSWCLLVVLHRQVSCVLIASSSSSSTNFSIQLDCYNLLCYHHKLNPIPIMNSAGFLGAFALILFIIPLGSAIKCYQCQSKDDKVCGSDDLPADPAPTHPAYKFLVDCSAQGPEAKNTVDPQFRGNEYTFCRKQVQDVEENKNIIRACGLVKGDKDCYTTANPPTKTLVCQCFEDGCNGAPSLTFSATLSTTLLALLLFCFRNA